jgi:hypothetical protein
MCLECRACVAHNFHPTGCICKKCYPMSQCTCSKCVNKTSLELANITYIKKVQASPIPIQDTTVYTRLQHGAQEARVTNQGGANRRTTNPLVSDPEQNIPYIIDTGLNTTAFIPVHINTARYETTKHSNKVRRTACFNKTVLSAQPDSSGICGSYNNSLHLNKDNIDQGNTPVASDNLLISSTSVSLSGGNYHDITSSCLDDTGPSCASNLSDLSITKSIHCANSSHADNLCHVKGTHDFNNVVGKSVYSFPSSFNLPVDQYTHPDESVSREANAVHSEFCGSQLSTVPLYTNNKAYSYARPPFRIKVDNKLVEAFSLPNQSTRDDSVQLKQFQELVAAHSAIVNSGLPNFQGCKIPLSSPLNIDFWRESLCGYDDQVVVEFLQYGFPVGYTHTYLPISEIKNHKGAVEFPEEVNTYLCNEIKMGVMAGPFSSNPLCTPLSISPLNSVPKKNKIDRRIISDLSFPQGSSVNDGIPKGYYLEEEVDLSFPSVDALASRLQVMGPSALMFKKDLQRAYRQFRIDPGDIHLLGYYWQGDLYLDLALAMGIRSAAHLCQRVTSAIKYIYAKTGYVLHNYIDDLAVCCEKNQAIQAFSILENLLEKLGIQEAKDKSYGPDSQMEFLGVLFDAPSMTMAVTPDRIQEILELIKNWLNKKKATKRELQVLIGKLQFIAKCVRSGRIFISRLLLILPSLRRQHHRFYVNKDFKRDLMWWQSFLIDFNGVSVIPNMAWVTPDTHFSTDSSLKACGGWCGNQYFSRKFPVSVTQAHSHINSLELITVMVALKIWAPQLANSRFLIYCDNEASVMVMNAGRTKDPLMLRIIREIAFLGASYNFQIRAIHVKGVDNRLSDILSRAPVDNKFHCKLQEVLPPQACEVIITDDLFDISNPW